MSKLILISKQKLVLEVVKEVTLEFWRVRLDGMSCVIEVVSFRFSSDKCSLKYMTVSFYNYSLWRCRWLKWSEKLWSPERAQMSKYKEIETFETFSTSENHIYVLFSPLIHFIAFSSLLFHLRPTPALIYLIEANKGPHEDVLRE